VHQPRQNDPHLLWNKNHEFGVNNLCNLNENWDQQIEQIGIQVTGPFVYRDLSVAVSAASSGDKLVDQQQTPLQRLQADRSVFLSAPPQNQFHLFTPTCHASRVMKCADIMDQEEEENIIVEAEEEQNLMSAQPPRLLPAPECAEAFTSRWFIAAPQNNNIERNNINYQNHQLNVSNIPTASINALDYASSGDFFNSNCCSSYNNNVNERNCLENSSVFWENYYNNHSSHNHYLEQQQQNNHHFSTNCNNNQNNNNLQYFSSSSQCLASSLTTSSSSSSFLNQSNPSITNNNQNNTTWHLWIDNLVKEVQAEVRAEKNLVLIDVPH
jgi:hypothetical protein